MNILQVTPCFYPATYYGGPVYTVRALCSALSRSSDVQLKVLTTDAAGPTRSLTLEHRSGLMDGRYPVTYFRRFGGRDCSPGLLLAIRRELKWSDVVHVHSVFCYSSFAAIAMAVHAGKPILWTPHGSLRKWVSSSGNNRLKQRWIDAYRAVLRGHSITLQVASELEGEEATTWLGGLRAIVVPHGVDLPSDLPERLWQPNGCTRLMYIGRLSPEKGIENLITAISLLPIDCRLSVYGSGDSQYVQRLNSLVTKCSLSERIQFKGQIAGAEKRDAFMHADIVVAPSFTENFCVSIAEALAHAVPVIAGDQTPWHEVSKNGCGLWIDNSPGSIADSVLFLREQPLLQMGVAGRKWMSASFQWSDISRRMVKLFDCLVKRVEGVSETHCSETIEV